MKPLVLDTTALIFLAKLTLLDEIGRVFSIVVTPEVAEEATRKQELPDARYIKQLLDGQKMRIDKASSKKTAILKKEWGIGKGESSALNLALSKNMVFVTDDYAAMRVAKTLNIAFATTPLLIVELCNQGHLGLELAEAKLADLQDFAWVSAEIIEMAKGFLKGGR